MPCLTAVKAQDWCFLGLVKNVSFLLLSLGFRRFLTMLCYV